MACTGSPIPADDCGNAPQIFKTSPFGETDKICHSSDMVFAAFH